MPPSSVTFAVLFLLSLVPAWVVQSSWNVGPLPPYVMGSAAVAGVLAASIGATRGRGVIATVALFVVAAAIAPFVAGGVTGFAVGLFAPQSHARSPLVGLETGLAGAVILYAFLAPLAATWWLLGFAVERAPAWWKARAQRSTEPVAASRG